MARRRSQRGSNRASGVRRQTSWEEGVGGTSSAQFAASGSAIVGSGVQPTTDGLTLVRTRGFVELVLTTITANLDGYSGGIGIGVVNTNAFGVGVSAVPLPLTEMQWDGWLWHQLFAFHGPAGGTLGHPGANLRFEIDSKAMRKVGLEDTIFASIEVVETGTAVMSYFLDSRMLFKLP